MRLAATVMLLRDAGEGIEILMVRRSSRSSFAPDAFVFPGGTVDPQDYGELPPGWDSRIAREFRARIPDELPTDVPAVESRDANALVRAAIREVSEEVAVEIDASSLSLFSHWITPPTEPKRYNTHFFVAAVPNGVHGTADAVETHDAQWIAPSEALARHDAGAMHLVYPTIKHLERLARFARVADVLAYTREKAILTIMPDRAPSEGFAMPPSLESAW